MKKDYKPYIIKKAYLKLQKIYTNHFISPGVKYLGKGFVFMKPWYINIFGEPIKIGKFVTIIAESDKRVYFSIWSKNSEGYISIGNFCIISPGVRISSAIGIEIDDNCMIASGVYITDSDWHGVYDRTSFGKMAPIKLEKNVWIGDSSIICKGVSIGENSIVAAGSIVVGSFPSNVLIAGNPAKIVKILDINKNFITRSRYYTNTTKLIRDFMKWELLSLKNNTIWGWIKSLFFPS